MLNIFQDQNIIQFKLSSEIKNVNPVIQNVRTYLKHYDIEDDQAIILILRELLNNAIEHGNKKKQDLTVSSSIENIGYRRFKLTVEDQGNGFDYKGLNLSIPDDPSQIRKRGLSLVNAFSDEIQFCNNGRHITVFLTLKQETAFHVIDETDWKVIKPVGNITSENIEQFRTLLLNLLNQGHSQYRFDLSDVQDIDSMALSIFVIFSNMISDRFPESKLEIIHAGRDIVNLFRMTRLDEIYKVLS